MLGTTAFSARTEFSVTTGSIDSLGNFVLEERYPEDQITGLFRGKFSDGCQVMQGYFSKPDGSRLQPFELRQVHWVGSERQIPDQDGTAELTNLRRTKL